MSASSVSVDVPALGSTEKVSIGPSTTVQEVIDQLLRTLSERLAEEHLDSYGLTCISKVPTGDGGTTSVVSSSLPTNEFITSFLDMGSLTFVRTSMELTVVVENEERRMTLNTLHTVARLLEQLKPGEGGHYELKVISGAVKARANAAVRMDPERALCSYRMRDSDRLLCSKPLTRSGFWRNVAGSTDVAVLVTSQEPHTITKTLRVPGDSTIDAVKRKFLQKANLHCASILYGIFFQFPSEDIPERLPDNMRLSAFPLPVPARLTCKLLPREPRKVFGVDPSTLPLVDYYDLQVPEILVIMREILDAHKGLEAEGIFRRAGSESEMKELKRQLEEGENITSVNVHSLATVIKRWFKELPQRLLVPLDKSLVEGDQAKMQQVSTFLPPMYGSLFEWLMDMLLVVVDNYDTTLMDTKNLAIVWGPGLLGSSDDQVVLGGDPFAGLGDTKFGIDAVDTVLVSRKGKPPLRSAPADSPAVKIAVKAVTEEPTPVNTTDAAVDEAPACQVEAAPLVVPPVAPRRCSTPPEAQGWLRARPDAGGRSPTVTLADTTTVPDGYQSAISPQSSPRARSRTTNPVRGSCTPRGGRGGVRGGRGQRGNNRGGGRGAQGSGRGAPSPGGGRGAPSPGAGGRGATSPRGRRGNGGSGAGGGCNAPAQQQKARAKLPPSLRGSLLK